MNLYTKGQSVRVRGIFKNESGSLIDPTTVRCTWKCPNGAVVTKTYNVDAAVIRESTGSYYADISADQEGIYYYTVLSEGSWQSAKDGSFRVVYWPT